MLREYPLTEAVQVANEWKKCQKPVTWRAAGECDKYDCDSPQCSGTSVLDLHLRRQLAVLAAVAWTAKSLVFGRWRGLAQAKTASAFE